MDVEVSRQRSWQLKKIGDGLCAICGKPRNAGKSLCDLHILKRRLSVRKRGNHLPSYVRNSGRRVAIPDPEGLEDLVPAQYDPKDLVTCSICRKVVHRKSLPKHRKTVEHIAAKVRRENGPPPL